MMEVLVTIAILVVGLLGMVGLQMRATTLELESYQRAQALVLLQEMVDRLSVNKPNAAAYVATNIGSTRAVRDCSTLTSVAEKDLCQWGNLLVGAAETSGSRNIGAMIGARGCISSTAANVYLVTVAWQGLSPTAAPSEACGQNAYGDDRQRRTVSTVVRVATLSAV
jgi:type IV pilus assembly protein PilV